MTLNDLIIDLKTSLMASHKAFVKETEEETTAVFSRLLYIAAADMHRVRPCTRCGTLDLVAGVNTYDAPDDLYEFKITTWGDDVRRKSKPWDPNYKYINPSVSIHTDGAVKKIVIDHTPTATDLILNGAKFYYYYYAQHELTETTSTIADCDKHLLILRAQAEAMRELSFRNLYSTTRVKSGTSKPNLGNPADLHIQLMNEFEAAA